MSAAVAVNLSEALAALVEAAGPSVVRVEAGRRAPSSGIVWADDVVVTADHAIEDEDGVEVGLADGRSVAASVAGRAEPVDLAVLRLSGAGALVRPAWSDGEGLKVAHLVVAVARPGRSARASLGIVSALGAEPWRTGGGGRVDRYLETDLALYPGFSGGLLLDAGGRALGLNSSGLLRGRSMALPAPTLRRVVEALLARGRVDRGFLGVGTQPVCLPPALAARAGQESGLMIVSVEAESPAERAGLLLGDVLVGLHGRPVRNLGELFEMLEEERIGVASSARVLRAGEPRDLPITVGARK